MKQRIVHGAEIDTVTPTELANELAKRRANVEIALGGGTQERLVEDIPLLGTDRQILSYRRGRGSDNLVIAAAVVTELCQEDPRRLAGNIQNIGANPVTIYLARQADVQVNISSVIVAGQLAAGGSGIWDFTLSKRVWCGPVCLFSTLGTTVIWGVC